LGQSLDNCFYLLRHQLPHSDVIQKKERLSAAGKNVVDAVIDYIHANGIVLGESGSNLQLGANSVNTGYQNWLIQPLELKKSAKEANATQHLGAEGSLGVFSNQLLNFGSGINANTSFSVGFLNLVLPPLS
jgi:hypothetical protein